VVWLLVVILGWIIKTAKEIMILACLQVMAVMMMMMVQLLLPDIDAGVVLRASLTRKVVVCQWVEQG